MDHGRKFCKACRKEAYKLSHKSWKERQYQIIPREGYKSLATEIIRQACRDYYDKDYHDEVVRFFRGNRPIELTGVDGRNILLVLERVSVRSIKRIANAEATTPQTTKTIRKPE